MPKLSELADSYNDGARDTTLWTQYGTNTTPSETGGLIRNVIVGNGMSRSEVAY